MLAPGDLLQQCYILDCLLHVPHLIRVDHRHDPRRPCILTLKRWTAWVVRRAAVWEVLWVVDDGADLSSTVSEHMDNVQQGQACIEYLHKQNIGCANFLVLEKIDENVMRTTQTPGNVPRLFDFVKPKEPRFTHAFYKALHDTLVVQDLAQANDKVFGGRRWRVVTRSNNHVGASDP